MSAEFAKRLNKARQDLLEKQRVCSWCGHRASTADGLVRHILETSSEFPHDRGPLTDEERELLTIQQKENAQ